MKIDSTETPSGGFIWIASGGGRARVGTGGGASADGDACTAVAVARGGNGGGAARGFSTARVVAALTGTSDDPRANCAGCVNCGRAEEPSAPTHSREQWRGATFGPPPTLAELFACFSAAVRAVVAEHAPRATVVTDVGTVTYWDLRGYSDAVPTRRQGFIAWIDFHDGEEPRRWATLADEPFDEGRLARTLAHHVAEIGSRWCGKGRPLP